MIDKFLVVLAAGIFFAFIYWAFSIPVVQVSHSTGECVSVHSSDVAHNCGNLPNRYTHEWVK